MLTPLFGLFIYLLIGSPKLPKKRRDEQKKTVDQRLNKIDNDAFLPPLKRVQPETDITPFALLNQNLSGFPVYKGNDINVIDDYEKAISSLVEDISKARKFVHIEYYIIAMDHQTKSLFKALKNAAERNVKIRLMYDAIGSKKYPNFKEMKRTFSDMSIEWAPMLPLRLPGKKFTRPDLRNHRKIAVIDGKIAYTGSLNLIDRRYHRKDSLYYDELVARVQGPVVSQFNAIFLTDWHSETGKRLTKQLNPELNFKPSIKDNILAQVLPSGPGFEDFNNLKLFTSLIHSAKKRIFITNPYFVPDDSLMVAITSAAQRGVEVIMINSKIIDQNFVGYAQRSYYEELLKAGVKIYLYKWPILLHSKHMTIDDGIAVIGSSNLDLRSFQLDLEVTLVAYDKTVVNQLKQVQLKNLSNSKKLSLTTWQKRPSKNKIFENIARLTSALQ
jgi:cardiolipin synthase